MGADLFPTLAYAFAMLLRLLTPSAEAAAAPAEYVVYVAPTGADAAAVPSDGPADAADGAAADQAAAVEVHRLVRNREAWEFFAPDTTRYGVMEQSRYFGEHYVAYSVGPSEGGDERAPITIDLAPLLRELPTDESYVHGVRSDSFYSGWIIQRLDGVFYVRAPSVLLWALPSR